ncbi:hypothetical protein TVAG_342360 [Trichomonas vaginalis G3]|uniref:Vps16 N-terminal domain-containing protein n=1 Tax=Trichomonas vaginalis (strain ATCC PRA-98 / G3) TaxID=412133 RepID=A2FME4_TRIV3|nr:regulation of vacuole fusion, non-autophagic [Trichomonas vaginalis G3]EAX93919.1 hypothetical protein TVAG_342360 [Trichomonas vaginalis G3]KAI5523192.1 regulation of vacuole fusion, non-autophagic [Trichomonas vaginalis G3]|eukprot:XP_001306849.1 hypothetical protein [Trichomonas vaginalis G3]
MQQEDINTYFDSLRNSIRVFNEGTEDTLTMITEPLFKSTNYLPDWEGVDFTKSNFRIAKHGGMMAVINTDYVSMGDYNPDIRLFSTDLTLVSTIRLPSGRNLADFYLTPEETLILLDTTGKLYIYNQRGQIITTKEVFEDQTLTATYACFYDTGVFVISQMGDVYLVEDFTKMTVSQFGHIPYSISALAVVPPHSSNDQSFDVALWVAAIDVNAQEENRDRLLCIQRDLDMIDTQTTQHFLQMVVSPSNDFVAVVACLGNDYDNKSIFFYSIDFSQCHAELQIGNITNEFKMNWCGFGTLLLTVPTQTDTGFGRNFKLVQVGLTQSTLTWDFEGGFVVATEVDGARIITHKEILLLRNVPDDNGVLSFITDKSKTNPGMKLFTAVTDRRVFATTDPLKDFEDTMHDALNQCLAASEFFTDIKIRHSLLEVVAKSKYVDPLFEVSKFGFAIEGIRICDNMSQAPIFMPLTPAQLSALRNDRLIVRLCNRYKHIYAKAVADYIGEKTDAIYSHWSRCVVRSSAPPQKIVKILKDCSAMYGGVATIDYIDLAQLAYELNKSNPKSRKDELGRLLLEQNTVASRRVPLHIQNGEWEQAIKAAIESNDEALLIYVIKRGLDHKQDSLIYDCVGKSDIALAAWLMVKPDDPDNSRLYVNAKRPKEAVNLLFEKAVREGKPMDSVIQFAKSVKDDYGVTVANTYNAVQKACRELGITGNAIDVIDKYLDQGNLSAAKSFAKSVNLEQLDITWRAAQRFIKNPTVDAGLNLVKEFKDNDDRVFIEMIADAGVSKDIINQIVNSVAPETREYLLDNKIIK